MCGQPHNVQSTVRADNIEATGVMSASMVLMLKKTGNKKNSPRVLQKKQPSTGNTIDADITPVAPNFNVVLGSAEHYEQKWLSFSKAAIHIIQSTTLNWGTGGT